VINSDHKLNSWNYTLVLTAASCSFWFHRSRVCWWHHALPPSADNASGRLSSFTEAAAPLGFKILWAKTKLQNLGSGAGPNSISVDGSNIESVENFICLGVCSLSMDAPVKISNAVPDWLHLLWPLFIEFGRISVSRSPISCGFIRLWFCLY